MKRWKREKRKRKEPVESSGGVVQNCYGMRSKWGVRFEASRGQTVAQLEAKVAGGGGGPCWLSGDLVDSAALKQLCAGPVHQYLACYQDVLTPTGYASRSTPPTLGRDATRPSPCMSSSPEKRGGVLQDAQ
ncbi:hypothetical protein O3P69_013070 [Scylla paramamosain]|uniref:Uncharacterized protein n=1 Tax=Scylla paramamosain TaxID=85552 RepID=A0AAW0TRV9_SCYPA